MKAVYVKEWGKPVELEEIPQPSPNSDEIMVRVHAASINPFDSAVHAGYMQAMLSTPLILGTDFAGEVVAIGSEITHVKPGDAVYGLVPMRTGTFAEYVTAKADEFSPKPRSLDYVRAAAVPLASLAAWQALFELAQLQQGERLLVLGVAGSAGSCAVQLAKGRASFIYGTGMRDNTAFLQGLGIDRFINAEKERFEDVVKDVDVVLDFVGGDSLERSYAVLRPGGRYVTAVIMQTPQEEAERRGIGSMSLATRPDAGTLVKLTELIDAGKLKVFVNRTFPLVDVQAALDFRLKTAAPGKIVLTMN
jgi:NADPH:quinone reductase-like Zn-dependent oxidoreductase